MTKDKVGDLNGAKPEEECYMRAIMRGIAIYIYISPQVDNAYQL